MRAWFGNKARMGALAIAGTIVFAEGQAAAGPPVFPQSLTAYTNGSGWPRVFAYVTEDDCIGGFVQGPSGWTFMDCVSNSGPSYQFGSTLIGYYAPSDATDHLFFIGENNEINEMWVPDSQASDMVAWTLWDNAAGTGAQKPLQSTATWTIPGCCTVGGIGNASTLAGFEDPSGVKHVFYVNQAQAVQELYRYNGRWWPNNLGGFARSVNGTGMAAQWANGEHVYVTGGDYNIYELFHGSSWVSNNLSALAGITPSQAPYGFLSASTSGGSYQQLYGPQYGNAAFAQLYYNGTRWSALLGGTSTPYLTTASPTTASGAGLAYVGSNRHVYVLTGIGAVDLTTKLGAPLAALGESGAQLSPIASAQAQNGVWIFYIGADNDMHAFVTTGGVWSTTDLSYPIAPAGFFIP